jgi:16S rRNA (adenine1518-N6/adenine1519-N6)-dimethyltransferase
MVPHPEPPVQGDQDAIFSVVKAAFAQRRKTLLNALSAAYGRQFTKEQLRQIILDCGLPETVRGERLSLEQFAVLSSALH